MLILLGNQLLKPAALGRIIYLRVIFAGSLPAFPAAPGYNEGQRGRRKAAFAFSIAAILACNAEGNDRYLWDGK
jgi:hypothetical protein